MIEQKIDPPNLGFWNLAKNYFQSTLAPYKKNQFGVSQIGKCSKETKFEKHRKFLILNPIFLYDRAKNRPPNLGFWNLAKIYFQSTLKPYQKKSVWGKSNWKVFKGDKIWKTSKIFNLKSYFSIWSSKKSTPPTWGFEVLLKFTFNLHLNTPYQKKSVWRKSNWKVFKGDKIWKTSKIFNLKSYFSIWSS